jgi:hypothetical protein
VCYKHTIKVIYLFPYAHAFSYPCEWSWKRKKRERKLLTCVSIGKKKKMKRKSCHGPYVIPSAIKINCSVFAPVEPLLSFQRKLSLAAFKIALAEPF